MHHIPLTAEAINSYLAECLSASPGAGVLALLPEAEKDKLALLQSLCQQQQCVLAGGIFPAVISGNQFKTDGACLFPLPAGLSPLLLPVAGEPAHQIAKHLSADTLSRLDQFAPEETRPTLFLFFDSMLPNIASLLDEIYSCLADRVRYAGVNAGSETFQAMPCLFNEKELIGNGILGLLLPGKASTILAHGFKQPDRILSATSTEGNRIGMIDWRPAFEVYQEIIKAQYNVDLTPENFYQYGVHFPFGILRANAEIIVRIPVGLAEDGSLYCVGEVPENAMLTLLKSPAPDEAACIQQLANDLLAENGSLNNRHLLTFYCAGRRMHMGDKATLELDILGKTSGVAELAGALSLGEIGCIQKDGYPMFHNATLVCTPWLTA